MRPTPARLAASAKLYAPSSSRVANAPLADRSMEWMR
jgi:hypothetical protein